MYCCGDLSDMLPALDLGCCDGGIPCAAAGGVQQGVPVRHAPAE